MRSSAWLLGGLVGRLVVPVAVVATLVAAPSGVSGASGSGVINAVGAENEYANVIGQIGGRYVHVSAVMSNPNTDPHTFEASTGVAREIAGAQLIVQNGVGYDTFMSQLESASPSRGRKVIDVQELLGLPLDSRQPAPLVQAVDDAGRGPPGRARPHRAGPSPARLLLRPARRVHPVAGTGDLRHRRVPGEVRG